MEILIDAFPASAAQGPEYENTVLFYVTYDENYVPKVYRNDVDITDQLPIYADILQASLIKEIEQLDSTGEISSSREFAFQFLNDQGKPHVRQRH